MRRRALSVRRPSNHRRQLRRLLAQGEMGADVRAWLDENVTGWNDENTRPAARGMRGKRTFAGQVRRIATFRARNRRMPSSTSEVQSERELGTFLVNHRQAAKGKGTTAWSESKRAHLDRALPGWDRRGGMKPAAVGAVSEFQKAFAVGL